jgi:hypothetical protein
MAGGARMPKMSNKGKDRENNKEFAKQLEKRTKKFSVRIIRLSTKLPNTP